MTYHVGAPSFIQKFVNLGLTEDMGCYRHCKERHCNKATECVEEFLFICEKNAWHKCMCCESSFVHNFYCCFLYVNAARQQKKTANPPSAA